LITTLHHTAQSAIPTKNRKLEYECHNFTESHFQQLDCICILFITRQAENSSQLSSSYIQAEKNSSQLSSSYVQAKKISSQLSSSYIQAEKNSSQFSSSYVQAEKNLHSFLQAMYKQKISSQLSSSYIQADNNESLPGYVYSTTLY
jgi:hypothetical protein